MRTLLLVGLALLLVAPARAGRHLKKPGAKGGFQTRVGDYTIQPGEDLEVCEYRRLGNAHAIDVSRFRLAMPPGAHHFALWGYGGNITDDSQFPPGPVRSVGCIGVGPDDPYPQLLIPTQSPNTDLRFPTGIALRIEPHEQVWLNPHMKNFGTTPTDPDVRFNFYRKKGKVEHYAEALTFGNSSDIHIPAQGDQTLVVEWTAPVNLTVIHLSTHQHSLGSHANIELVEPDGVTRRRLVETDDWEHPGSVWPDGGLRVAKGQKMRITCSWHNSRDHVVGFGTKTTDEMCFAIGFFYRDAGDTDPVVGSGCIPARKGLLCPLAPAVSN